MVEDKKGRVDHPSWLIDGFRNVVNECNLIDLPLVGYPFTWSRSRGSDNVVKERLDRALVTDSWLQLFPYVCLRNLVSSISDHSPILIVLKEQRGYFHRRSFKFENSWLDEQGLKEVVQSSWDFDADADSLTKLNFCVKDMEHWIKSLKINFRKDIDDCKKSIEESRNGDDAASVTFFNCQNERLISMIVQEETYWRKRDKVF